MRSRKISAASATGGNSKPPKALARRRILIIRAMTLRQKPQASPNLTEAGRTDMKIARKDPDSNFEQWHDWHVLVIAKPLYGMSALDFYGRVMHGVDTETIEQFAKQVNDNFETRTLYPRAPVSAIPERYMYFIDHTNFIVWLDDFWRNIKEFAEANRTTIHAGKILVDLHRDSDPVPDFFLTAAERAFAEYLAEDEVDEIVIMR
jgi:hypothetical protein